MPTCCRSHLLQMRGLKLPIILKSINLLLSHLLQMRGLKPSLSAMFERGQIRSHLLQMRGLKLVMLIHLLISVLVASFTDAWIETGLKESRRSRYVVASFTDAWIETVIRKSLKAVLMVASFTDAWIET